MTTSDYKKNEDWWNLISEAERKAIDKGLDDLYRKKSGLQIFRLISFEYNWF